MIVGELTMHSIGNTNGMEGGRSGDDDATHSGGKGKRAASTRQIARAQHVNAVAGPSQPERQRRRPKRPDADVPTPSPKRRHK
jgi:hypothetical protein